MLKVFDEEPFVTEINNKRNWKDDSLSGVRKKIKVHLKNICKDSCYFCKSSVRGREATIEHIVSKSKYDIFTYKPHNLILCCSDCNSLKNDNDVFSNNVNRVTLLTWDDYPMKSNEYTIIHPYIDKYDDHLVRAGISYKYLDTKGLETIKAYNLDRLSLAEKNAMRDNYNGLLYEILKDTSIDEKRTKEKLEEILNPKPKYAPFNEFINLKLRGTDRYNDELIKSIKELNSDVLNNFNEVLEVYENNKSNISNVIVDKLNNTLEILKIIKQVIWYANDRRQVRVLCSYNINEISQYLNKDIFLNSDSEQVVFAIKFLDILSTLNKIDFISKHDSIKDYINKFESEVTIAKRDIVS